MKSLHKNYQEMLKECRGPVRRFIMLIAPFWFALNVTGYVPALIVWDSNPALADALLWGWLVSCVVFVFAWAFSMPQGWEPMDI